MMTHKRDDHDNEEFMTADTPRDDESDIEEGGVETNDQEVMSGGQWDGRADTGLTKSLDVAHHIANHPSLQDAIEFAGSTTDQNTEELVKMFTSELGGDDDAS